MIFAAGQIFSYSFGKNKIQREKIDWKKIETLHFDIYFPGEHEEFAQTATLLCEKAYYQIKADLKRPIKSRIPVIFYHSHQAFETTNIIMPLLNESVGGFTETSKNRVAIPFDGSYKKMEEIIIHELTHAYINAISNNVSQFFPIRSLPFWFSEGLPEFEAIQGENAYNRMFVSDKIFNEEWGSLEQIYGYFAYRLGESFLVYINEKYGRKKIVDLFYALRYQNTSKQAFKKIFGKDFQIIQKEWKNYLKRRYYPIFEDYHVPYEIAERKTDHQKDGSSINYAPSFSPDGNHYIYFSNKDLKTDIYKGSTLNLYKNQKILSAENSGKFQEFHFQSNNLSWFKDGKRFAFVSKTAFGDKIYVMDFQTEEIVEEYDFSEFDAIFEIDVSNDGTQIVFSGQKDFQNDLYIFSLETKEIQQITNDNFFDGQPRWSENDKKIVFASERSIGTPRDKVFANLSFDIFYYDLKNKQFYQVTDDEFNNEHPIWHKNKIIFSTERNEFLNYDIIDLNTGQRGTITKNLVGVFMADINNDASEMIYSVYYNGGWDIYLHSNPLAKIDYYQYNKPKPIEFTTDFYQAFDLERHRIFGKREREFKRELPEYPDNITKFDPLNYAEVDSTIKNYNRELDEMPQDENPPDISEYKLRYSLDYLWGGAAYSPALGTYAQVQMAMSDLMRNHLIGLNLGVTGNLERSDAVLSYLNQTHKTDYGLGGFYLNDETIYRITYNDESDDDFFRERIKDIGFYALWRYPINIFWRIDLENSLQKSTTKRDWWDGDEWKEEYLDPDVAKYYDLETKETEYIFTPQISLVHDNVIYGNVGPLLGWRGALIFNHSFSTKDDYSIVFGDLRKYFFFAKKYSFAMRFLGGSILGNTDQRFDMDYFAGVRGYDDDEVTGRKKIVTSFELRYPFLDNFKMSFPLPLQLQSVRGSGFIDLGAIWKNNEDLKLTKENRLEDLKIGFGFGPRLNMGYFVLKLDVAWLTDLESFTKPTYYFSLTPDF